MEMQTTLDNNFGPYQKQQPTNALSMSNFNNSVSAGSLSIVYITGHGDKY